VGLAATKGSKQIHLLCETAGKNMFPQGTFGKLAALNLEAGCTGFNNHNYFL
jgi:hypothetical protein